MDTPSKQQIEARKYKVFISYRHADNREPGRQWATWLHQTLETYDIPKDLVGKQNSYGEKIPERIFPVFRDEEELSVDANLASSIVTALDNSEHLIVICSPQAVASTYVEEEIAYFKKIGKGEHIMAMMVEGEPHSPDEECFPIPLRFDEDAKGNQITSQSEPIAADFRIQSLEKAKAEPGWTSPEAYKQALEESTKLPGNKIKKLVDSYRKQHELMKLKIISGILDIPLGELSKRDQAYQIELANRRARTLRRWLATVGLLAILAIGGGIFAWLQKQEAVKQEAIATENYSQQLTAKALEDLKETRVEEGLAGFSRSLYVWPDNKVSRDRLLFELAYRGWLIPHKHYPVFPAITLNQASLTSSVVAGNQTFTIDTTSTDGYPVLNQRLNFDTKTGETKSMSRTLNWNKQNAWQSSKPKVSEYIWEYEKKFTLPNGKVISSLPNAEVPLGYGYIEGLNATGIIALSPSKKTLAVAGFYEGNYISDTVNIRFFNTTSLKELEPAHSIQIPQGLDVEKLIWEDDYLVLSTSVPNRRFPRIDIMKVQETSQKINVQRIIENRLIPGKSWDFHQGKLYVSNQYGLSVYQPTRPFMENWSAQNYPVNTWRELTKTPEDDYSSFAWQKLKAISQTSGMQAELKEANTVALKDQQGSLIKTIETQPRDSKYNDFRAIGFSPDGKTITLVNLNNPGEGDVYLNWETYYIEYGLELFPPSTRYDTAEGPPLLSHLFLPLEPLGWMTDGRGIAFKYWQQSAYLPDDQYANHHFQNYWLTHPQDNSQYMVFPVIWTDQPTPSWFLDTVSQILHVKDDAVRGLEIVPPSTRQPFKAEVERVIQEHGGKGSDQDYVEFLKKLAGSGN